LKKAGTSNQNVSHISVFCYKTDPGGKSGSSRKETALTYEPQYFEYYWNKLKLTFHSLPEDGVSGLAIIKLILFFEKDIFKTLPEKLTNQLHYFSSMCSRLTLGKMLVMESDFTVGGSSVTVST